MSTTEPTHLGPASSPLTLKTPHDLPSSLLTDETAPVDDHLLPSPPASPSAPLSSLPTELNQSETEVSSPEKAVGMGAEEHESLMDEQMPQETHEDGEEVKAVEASGNGEVKEKAGEKATNGHGAAEEEKSGPDGAGAVKKVENGVKKVATSAVGGVKRILESKAFGGSSSKAPAPTTRPAAARPSTAFTSSKPSSISTSSTGPIPLRKPAVASMTARPTTHAPGVTPRATTTATSTVRAAPGATKTNSATSGPPVRRASMAPPASTRPLTSTTANARTTTATSRKATASPALSATSENMNVMSTPSTRTPATTPARVRASLAPSFGSTRSTTTNPSTTGVRRPSPPNGSATISTVKPGHTRTASSISSTTAPRIGLAGARATGAVGGTRGLASSVGGGGVARKPEGTGRKELEDKIASLEASLATLQITLTDLEASHASTLSTKDLEVSSLRDKVAATQTNLDALKTTHTEPSSAAASTAEEVAAAMAELASKEKELTVLREKVERENEELRSEVEMVKAELEGERKEREGIESGLKENLSAAELKHSKLAEESSSFPDILAGSQAEISTLREKYSSSESRVTELEAALAAASAGGLDRVNELTQEVKAAQARADAAVEEAESARDSLIRINAEMESIREEANSLDISHQGLVADLRAKIDELAAELASTKEELEKERSARATEIEETRLTHEGVLAGQKVEAAKKLAALKSAQETSVGEAVQQRDQQHQSSFEELHASHSTALAEAVAAAKLEASQHHMEEIQRKEAELKAESEERAAKLVSEKREVEEAHAATKGELETIAATHASELAGLKESQALEIAKASESAKNEAGSEHSHELRSLRVEYESTIEQLRNAQQSETEALRSSHETIQISFEADSSKEISNLNLDLAAHKQDLAKARAEVQSHADELETLRDQLAASRSALEESRSAPAASTDTTALDALRRQLNEVNEELASTRESANLTKHALSEELEHTRTNHQQELQLVSEGRVAQVEAAKKEHEQELLKLLSEKRALLEEIENEREAKDRALSQVANTIRSPPTSPRGSDHFESPVSKLHEAHNKKVSELEAELSTLKRTVQDLVGKQADAEAEVHSSKLELAMVEEERKALEDELESVQDQLKKAQDDLGHNTSF